MRHTPAGWSWMMMTMMQTRAGTSPAVVRDLGPKPWTLNPTVNCTLCPELQPRKLGHSRGCGQAIHGYIGRTRQHARDSNRHEVPHPDGFAGLHGCQYSLPRKSTTYHDQVPPSTMLSLHLLGQGCGGPVLHRVVEACECSHIQPTTPT
jgi:hypothetical protein